MFGRCVGQGSGRTGWEARAVEDMEAVLCGASCLFSVQPGRQGTGASGEIQSTRPRPRPAVSGPLGGARPSAVHGAF